MADAVNAVAAASTYDLAFYTALLMASWTIAFAALVAESRFHDRVKLLASSAVAAGLATAGTAVVLGNAGASAGNEPLYAGGGVILSAAIAWLGGKAFIYLAVRRVTGLSIDDIREIEHESQHGSNLSGDGNADGDDDHKPSDR